MTASPPQIDSLIEAMSPAEKLTLVHGTAPSDPFSQPAVGYLEGLPEHGIEPLRFADGPLGVRSGAATAFPAALGLGATFDPGLAEAFGQAVGAEARAKAIDVVLAPGCNLIRVPHCGRAFEYFGEDPHHSARLTAGVVEGIQSAGPVATPKHYVANNQEHDRVRISAQVSERALRELYLPAFEAAIEAADAGAIMAAYNRINGTYACEHDALLRLLKDEFGFDGPVMSDWWAVQDPVAAAAAGLDLEMPGTTVLQLLPMNNPDLEILHRIGTVWPAGVPGPAELVSWLARRAAGPGGVPEPTDSLYGTALPDAVSEGGLSEDRLDEMVRRVLTLHHRVGALEGTDRQQAGGDVDWAAHRDLAYRIATQSAVLLTNEADTLPLDEEVALSVFGPAIDDPRLGGGGSSAVAPRESVTPLAGLRARGEGRVHAGDYHPPIDRGKLFDVSFNPLDREAGLDTTGVAATAVRGDVAVVLAEDSTTEGRDRASLSLPGHQDQLIETVAAAAEKTVVVLQTAGAVELPWLSAVDAVLALWYPGQEAGRAIAAVLYGDVDPGGRLPVTFAPAEAYPTSPTERYPGVEHAAGYPTARYGEGVFVGYRYFDAHDQTPTFPFGHGHSYTSFVYDDLAVTGTVTPGCLADGGSATATVSVRVTNTGARPGREVVQCYLREPDPPLPRPPRELVGFESLGLDPGESAAVTFDLDGRAFAYWNAGEADTDGGWTIGSQQFVVAVGRSAWDIRTSARIES